MAKSPPCATSNVVDPDSLNPDPAPAFQVNPDPDVDSVPGPDPKFDDQKLKKKTAEIFSSSFFDKKNCNLLIHRPP
jgi:hypothetical protein